MILRASILSIGLLLPVFAQQPSAAQPPAEEDASGRGVARLSVMSGEVSVRRGDSGDVIAAALNAPLVVTDRVLTGPQSRAELQFDWANMIRLGSNSEVRLSELENRRYQIQVAIGTTTFRVLRDSNADVEISTPSVSVRPLMRGVYRVSVHEDGSSEISVRAGEAEIFTPRGSERLQAGNTMFARGSATEAEFQVGPALPPDDWDGWNESRDSELQRGNEAYRHISPDVYGAEDLEGQGRWVNVAGYGDVWSPAVDPGWAPYRYGRWSWVDFYGWTWISYDPWGWAPYHYGRWFAAPGYGWCWWPGPMYGRHYWRPALVAFFGWGGHGGFHSGIGFGFGNIGWIPLAPHEPFHPWYGRGFYGGYRNNTIVNNTTIVNNINIANTYRNARVVNGITAVNSDAFGRRNVTNGDLVRVNASELQGAGLVRGVLPLTPARESLRLSDRNASSTPRVSGADRSFFSRRPASVVDRVPFEQQRQGMERVTQRTFSNGGGNGPGVSPRTGASATDSMRRGAQEPAEADRGNQQVNNGWRRVGEPAPNRQTGVSDSSAPAVRSAPSQDSTSHRFGDPAPHAAPSGDSGNWRRFGDQGTSGTRTAPNPGYSAPQDRSQPSYNAPADRGYRAPERSAPPSAAPAPAQPPVDRGYRAPERSAPSSPAPAPAQPPADRGTQRRPDRSDNGWNGFGNSGATRFGMTAGPTNYAPPHPTEAPERTYQYQQPVRISPPMVRERPSAQPSYGGGGGRSYSAPAGAPHQESRGSGSNSSGGSSRSSAGGGGGSHSRGR